MESNDHGCDDETRDCLETECSKEYDPLTPTSTRHEPSSAVASRRAGSRYSSVLDTRSYIGPTVLGIDSPGTPSPKSSRADDILFPQFKCKCLFYWYRRIVVLAKRTRLLGRLCGLLKEREHHSRRELSSVLPTSWNALAGVCLTLQSLQRRGIHSPCC